MKLKSVLLVQSHVMRGNIFMCCENNSPAVNISGTTFTKVLRNEILKNFFRQLLKAWRRRQTLFQCFSRFSIYLETIFLEWFRVSENLSKAACSYRFTQHHMRTETLIITTINIFLFHNFAWGAMFHLFHHRHAAVLSKKEEKKTEKLI